MDPRFAGEWQEEYLQDAGFRLAFEQRLDELRDVHSSPAVRYTAAKRLLRDDMRRLLTDEQMRLAEWVVTNLAPGNKGRRIKVRVP